MEQYSNRTTPGNLSSLALLQKTDKPLLNREITEITLRPTPRKFMKFDSHY
jgi:hypothetical protein